MPDKDTQPERFWAKVEFTDTCWLWRASVSSNKGYGQFDWQPAHRWAYEFCVGPIPKGMMLDHLCRVRHCVNPSHLEPVSHMENVRRGLKGVLRTHCREGHLLSGDNLMVTKRNERRCRICINAHNRMRRMAWQ